jgi:hypothetical protein
LEEILSESPEGLTLVCTCPPRLLAKEAPEQTWLDISSILIWQQNAATPWGRDLRIQMEAAVQLGLFTAELGLWGRLGRFTPFALIEPSDF